jgi:hypothetical protein
MKMAAQQESPGLGLFQDLKMRIIVLLYIKIQIFDIPKKLEDMGIQWLRVPLTGSGPRSQSRDTGIALGSLW